MKASKDGSRWFILGHECGSTFTVNTSEFIEKINDNLDLRCPNCFEKIGPNLLKTLEQFFGLYELLIDKLTKNNFTIREVFEDEVDSEL
jgi:DNA-directed RNA polymerase subunit RPC12/RpoP